MAEVIHKINELLNRRFILDHPVTAVAELESMDSDEVARLLTTHPLSEITFALGRLTPDFAREVLAHFSPDLLHNLLIQTDSLLFSDLLSQMDPEECNGLLSSLPAHITAEYKRLMSYPSGSAGHWMDTRFHVFRETMSVKQCLHRLRHTKIPKSKVLYLVDNDNRLTSKMDIQDLVLANYNDLLRELAHPLKAVCQPLTPIEEVIEMMEEFKLDSVAVADSSGKIAGIIHHDALIKAVEEEATLDIQTMFGVSKEEQALSKPGLAIRKRLPWLHINLLTAFLASAVVGLFEDTIARFTALAVLLPVVAGQSGNAGAQSLAVTMRGLTLREISIHQFGRVVLKEMTVGFVNGLAVAATTSLGVYLWSRSYGLAAIIGISMVLAMVTAGFAGASVPIILTRLGQDPATASSIILTTVTDVAGFFSFLGIAVLLSSFL